MKQNPLILHLKYGYWLMIRAGNKTHEYREAKPYWASRIHDQKDLILVPGYNHPNDLNILAKIKNINIIHFDDLPDYAQKLFKNSEWDMFFDIEFEV